jgi:mannose-6-phosphate isomerase
VKPIALPPNQPRQFYRGGRAIAAFRTGNAGRAEEFGPEDWVASATTLFGQDAGLTVLPDGTTLRDAIAADPVSYLGAAHTAVYESSPALLVKLLDAGERLPVHVHPDRAFAQQHLNCQFGKTEAWLVIGTSDSDAAVYVGFKADVDQAAVDAWVKSQRSEMLLETLNRIPVRRGDTVLIPAGTPHAIGAGVFIIELQEPTDFSVMLEWEKFGLASRAEEQLGLPSALALSCVDRTGWSNGRLSSCVSRGALSGESTAKGARSVLPPKADPFFRAVQIVTDGTVTLEPQYGVLVVLDGNGKLEGDFGDAVEIGRGDTVLVPHAAGEVTMGGDLNVVRCLPPAVSAA